ncbi:TetR family transcriptional regulator [Marinobacter sp. HL-58]|uniref:TetR family transcriptional regulator n=1 Tax=Marinobacter sp. HL-58 TaxID=1479237 RepID=UPI00056262DC|nr:TetR family transcriptional regulator [Marinobacter sp. HL-58]KPQ02953.1 MAG: transcriptional repressor of AcrAB operon AcrR [Marinobacter sp. HL-58]
MARKTKAEAEATRQTILDAAEQVFMDKGVAHASLEEIARTAQVTRGAVYWHFQNKSDVFNAMLERVHLPMAVMVEDAASAQSGDLTALRDLCIFALKTLVEDKRHFRVYKILFHHTESDRGLRMQEEIARESIEMMTRFFHNHPPHPALTATQAARSLHTQMLGIYYDWLRNPDAFDLAAEATSLVDTIFRGICPEGSLSVKATENSS